MQEHQPARHRRQAGTRPLAAALAPALAAALAAGLTACSADRALAPAPAAMSAQRDARPADPTRETASTEWSAVARDLVIAQRSNAFQAVRNYATLNLAQYEAALALDHQPGRRRVSVRAAVAAASAAALAYLYPSEAGALEERVRGQLATPGWLEPGSPDVETGLAAGRAAATRVVERAKTDRFYDPWTGTMPTGPGVWYSSTVPPTPPGGAGFGTARTFFLTSPAQFRPGPPPTYGSPAFDAALAEVRHVSDTRTPVQDSLARYWALPVGTYTVAGWWNREAAALATRQRLGEHSTARLLATASMAAYDALLACNDAKYVYWLLRPTQADPAIRLAIALPNFPSYPSNTACISAAEAEVIAAAVPGERQRLRSLATEAAVSRVHAGIHYRFDGDVGLALGRQAALQALRWNPGRGRTAIPPQR